MLVLWLEIKSVHSEINLLFSMSYYNENEQVREVVQLSLSVPCLTSKLTSAPQLLTDDVIKEEVAEKVYWRRVYKCMYKIKVLFLSSQVVIFICSENGSRYGIWRLLCVVPNLYISKKDFTKLRAEVIASIYLSEVIYWVTIKVLLQKRSKSNTEFWN